MLVVTGVFEDGLFIPDKPVSIPQRKKVVVTIEEEKSASADYRFLTMEQIEEWANESEIRSLAGILKGANLPDDVKLSDIRNERLAEKY